MNNNDERKKKSGKQQEDEKIIDYVKTNSQTNLSKVRKKLKLTVSSTTIGRRLAEEGINYYIPAHMPVKKIKEKD